MPKETFWDSTTAVEGDGTKPYLTIEWKRDTGFAYLNGIPSDRSGLDRLIKALQKARGQVLPPEEAYE